VRTPAVRALYLVAMASVVSVLGIAIHVQPASADADPASDTLLVQDAFFPYTPSTPAPLQRGLETALNEIHATGIDLKVAIIGSQIDLGGIPELFGQPSRYARFLDTEISLKAPQPLLVVMPDGVSVEHAGSSSAVGSLPVDRTHGSAGLVRTAIDAVRRIAVARGEAIAAPRVAGGGGGGLTPLLLAGGALVLILIATGAVVRGRAGTRRSGAAARG
jgi:hypothetical protein